MVELADTHDSKSCAERHEGSSPSLATKQMMSQAYMSKIERGGRRIDAAELDELAKLYGKLLDYFEK